jgi:hypothetical protein
MASRVASMAHQNGSRQRRYDVLPWVNMLYINKVGLRVLEKLHARPDDPFHVSAREEYMQIHKQTELEKDQKVGNLLQLFRHPTYRTRLLYGFFFQVLAQMTGVLVINNYQVN